MAIKLSRIQKGLAATRILACLTVAILIPAANAADAEHAALLIEVGRYADELARVQAAQAEISLESILADGMALATQLRPVLEVLSDTEYEEVQANMKGFVIERIEGAVAEPDYTWFLSLAENIGSETDRAFLALQLKLRPNGYWPAYLYRLTDYGGCTLFGEHLLSDLYAEATALLPDLPAAYRSHVEREINQLTLELRYPTCACSDKDSVIDEFRYFLQTNPGSEWADTVRSRLTTVQDDTEEMRYQCRPG
jgi:hypothetical protein